MKKNSEEEAAKYHSEYWPSQAFAINCRYMGKGEEKEQVKTIQALIHLMGKK